MKHIKQNLKEEYSRIMELMDLPPFLVEQSSTKTRDKKEGSKGLIKVITNKKKDKWGDTTYNLILSKTKKDFGGTIEPGDEVYEKIENEVGDLTGKKIQLSSTPKKFSLGRDRWTFKLVDETAPEPTAEERAELDTVNTQPSAIDAQLEKLPPDEAGEAATEQTQVKIYKLSGDKTWEYKVEDEIWYTRKQGGDGKWISLKTNQEASAKLDDKFPNAREAQEEMPDDAAASKQQKFPYARIDTPEGYLTIPEDAMKEIKNRKEAYGNLLKVGDPDSIAAFEQYMNDNNIPMPDQPEDAVASQVSEAWGKCPCVEEWEEFESKGIVYKKKKIGDALYFVYENCRFMNNETRKMGRVDCKSGNFNYDSNRKQRERGKKKT